MESPNAARERQGLKRVLYVAHVAAKGEQTSYHDWMSNLAAALKSEIVRLARKEIRGETQDIKKASSQHRTHIAALRRRLEALEHNLKRIKGDPMSAGASASDDTNVHRRFSAARLASTRKKLGLSAADFGALIGVTGQSIYKWESGEARPRAKQLEAIAAVRSLGKRDAMARLEALRSFT